MILNLFRPQALLDEDAVQWTFEVFAWALQHLDPVLFRDHTVLVLPSDRFFPGRADSVHGMAELMFHGVCRYAGVGHWPRRLVAPQEYRPDAPLQLLLEGPLRQVDAEPDPAVPADQSLTVSYDPRLVNQPQALIASFAHLLAHYLGALAAEPPPGGEENRPHAGELVAVFLGFGVMLANSAYNAPASCGSCSAGSAQRQGYLSRHHLTYALALFCVLKGIPASAAAGQLERPLRPFFKKAMKEVASRDTELASLRARL